MNIKVHRGPRRDRNRNPSRGEGQEEEVANAGAGFAAAAVLLRKSFILERSRRLSSGEAVEGA